MSLWQSLFGKKVDAVVPQRDDVDVNDEEGQAAAAGTSLFERTWEAAIELCRKGAVQGQVYRAAVKELAEDPAARPVPRFAVLTREGEPYFVPPADVERDGAALFAVARRLAELEDASERGVTPPPYIEEPRRTCTDSLREWGLLDDQGNVLKAYEPDPEPLLGYVVRYGSLFAYGVVKQSVLTSGPINITPTGVCEGAEEARRRAGELLMLALVRGATVMGMNGVPAVIDLSAEPQES